MPFLSILFRGIKSHKKIDCIFFHFWKFIWCDRDFWWEIMIKSKQFIIKSSSRETRSLKLIQHSWWSCLRRISETLWSPRWIQYILNIYCNEPFVNVDIHAITIMESRCSSPPIFVDYCWTFSVFQLPLLILKDYRHGFPHSKC